ncbi:hypothetical protein HSX11_13415 [Oxalobacteraceae bacterium]|nr:hypothetical protein [Oxalobacteraceae bacterium]
MTLLTARLAALEAWFARRTAFLQHPKAVRYALVLMPLLFGLYVLLQGQDDNWDLRNYHLYNAYALMNGRIGFDLAPGRFQTYFNPTIDLPHYLLLNWFSAPLAGFVFGVLHGLNFVLLFAIARELLGKGEAGGGYRLPLLLAAAGTLGPAFLGEMGNSMGDNTTAPLVLGSLWMVLRHWELLLRWNARAARTALLAGLLIGMGTGLKLTNATYAAALCLALCALPLGFRAWLRLSFVYGAGVLGGIALTAGWWFWKMWLMFGNPLFPQFNNVFHAPLARESGVIDTYFLPKNLGETVLWPFLFWLDSHRVSELPIKLAMWPVVYTLFLALALTLLWRRLRPRGLAPARSVAGARGAFVLMFFGLAFVAWMRLFSIYRYLIPLELLVPLVIVLLLQCILPRIDMARRLAGYLLVALALGSHPVPEWGHVGWTARGYSAEVPDLPAPGQTLVFIVQPHPPLAWLATFFPAPVKFIGLDTGFPESALYRAQVAAALAERAGPHYVMLAAAKNEKEVTRQHKLDAARWLGLTGSESGCARLEWLSQRVRLQLDFRRLPTGGCTLDLQARHQLDLVALDAGIVGEAAQHIVPYGLQLDAASCKVYPAAVGEERYPYRLCAVRTSPPGK